ncbi:MAG TPA: YggT family protein [Acidimicrobiia bacterium]|nr:YggT family protein [Acidimicrobiia bacterium]
MQLICTAISIYALVVLAWVILSWVQVSSMHPLGRVQVFLDRLIYPLILPLRRVLPPLRLGGAMIDLSPLVLIFGLQILRRIIC